MASVKNAVLKVVVQTTRSLAHVEDVATFGRIMSGSAPNLAPRKYGSTQPLKGELNYLAIEEQLKHVYSGNGEDVLFGCGNPVAGYMNFDAAKGVRAWSNGFHGTWDFSSAVNYLHEAHAVLREGALAYNAAYAGMSVGGGNFASVNIQDPRQNFGVVNGIVVPPVSISGIQALHGICWVNIFGEKYIEFFERSLLAKVPCYKSEFLDNGRYFLFQVTEHPEEMFAEHGVKLTNQIREVLGHPRAFQDYPRPVAEKRIPPWLLEFEAPSFDFSELRIPSHPV